ncbi:hypothetical protein OSB04_029360 [Centaurea solstitialis]|uniref:Uncharacterized protein n=1 Tax=Centaurea solstitialis TaxID=347529 RepID=A0AA38WA71_9ASTR|nr:hypothetical protein OSB04_029360 [Centaurea solstitialis]
MSRDCLENFGQGIIHLYKRKNLPKPTANDVQTLYELHEQRHGFPGMLGSIDFVHWDWKNCLVARRVPDATIDIVIVNQSLVFNDSFKDKAPDSSFDVNGAHYKHDYYLTDGICPEWATFIKASKYRTDIKWKKFKAAHESARKDIERAFALAEVSFDRGATEVAKQYKFRMAEPLAEVSFDSWSSKKQNCVSTSTTQAEDYGYTFDKIPILCDSKSAIAISANPVQHSKTKHIDIRYHFLKHYLEEGNVEMNFVNAEFQLTDLFTKALDEKRFNFLVEKIGMTGPLP